MNNENAIIVLAHRLADDAECEFTPETLASLRLRVDTIANLIEAEQQQRADR